MKTELEKILKRMEDHGPEIIEKLEDLKEYVPIVWQNVLERFKYLTKDAKFINQLIKKQKEVQS